MRVLDPRVMLAMGFAGFAFGTWIVTAITKDWDFWELLWPQIFRGVSLMLCMVTVNNIALGTLSPDRLKNASGLFNLTRNLGGAIGLALINTVLNNRMDLHLAAPARDGHLDQCRCPGAARSADQEHAAPGLGCGRRGP